MTYKCEYYVPEAYLEKIMKALDEAGFLRVGNYCEVYAITRVRGHWRATSTARPFLGEQDAACEAEEVKVEFNVAAHERAAVQAIITKHHPYEEALIRFLPME